MDDKNALTTGSTDGIGKQTAIELAEMGARLILHGRSESRAKQVIQEIEQKTGNNRLDFFIADLSSLQQIRTISAEIRRKYKKIDVLINNAVKNCGNLVRSYAGGIIFMQSWRIKDS